MSERPVSISTNTTEIHFVREASIISNTSHSSAKFLHGIKVLMARNYVENLSEEVKKGMHEKARQGGYPTMAPVGYVNTKAPYQGKYEPRAKPRQRDHTFTYTGLLRYATCGGMLTGDIKKQRYIYYACREREGCKRFYPERVFEDETLRLLRSLQIDTTMSEWLLSELAASYDAMHDDDGTRTMQLQQRANELRAMLRSMAQAPRRVAARSRRDRDHHPHHDDQHSPRRAFAPGQKGRPNSCKQQRINTLRSHQPSGAACCKFSVRTTRSTPEPSRCQCVRPSTHSRKQQKVGIGWETGTRTPIQRSRAACPTIERSPRTAGGGMLHGG
jgi:hypothetical protein